MKIALVYPSKNEFDKQMPLGLGYIASFILANNENINIKIVDTGISKKREIEDFLHKNFDIIGFSITSKSYSEAITLAERYKNEHHDVKIVFGGPHVSIVMENILHDHTIDFGIYGEGELTFNELIQYIKGSNNAQKNVDFKDINGLIYRSGGKVFVNSPRDFINNVDDFPFPAFHLFPMARYSIKLPMITSRGCPFSCVFCASSKIWGRVWRPRSPENIIKEVEHLIKIYGPRPIEFHDDGFNMNLKRLDALCDLFIKRKGMKIPFSIRGFRADIINPSIAKKLKNAGCSHIAIGIESANPEMLVHMGKKLTIGKIQFCIDVLNREGIDVIGQFMIGNPGETIQTVQESIDFAQHSGLSSAVFGTAVPFPGTDIWDYVNNHGNFLVDPDCTKFERIEPRILFETPEFTREERMEAIRLTEDAGMLYSSRRKEKHFHYELLLNIVLKIMYKTLPSKLSYKLYFFMRKMKARLSK